MSGTVRDAENSQPLGGVQVSLIELDGQEERQAYTDHGGQYLFLAVRAGHCAVRFQKRGYQTYVIHDVHIQGTRTSYADLEMQKILSNGQQTVSLNWQGKLDNPWGSAHGAVFDHWSLDSLPRPHNIWEILENQQASTVTNQNDEGGISTGVPALVGVFGDSWTQNGYQFDDLNVTDPFETGKPLVYPDLGSLQEFQVDTAFHLPPARFPGGSLNMRSRQGTRTFHGDAAAYYQGEPFQSSNVDERLRSLGFTSIQRFKRYSEGRFSLGGAVPHLNKWSYFASFDFQHLSKVIPGFPAVPETTLYSGLLRLDASLNPRDHLSILASGQSAKSSNLGARPGVSPSATLLGNDRFEIVQGHWSRLQSPTTIWQIGFGFSHASPTDTFQHGVKEPNQTQMFTEQMSGAAPMESDSARSRFSLLGQGQTRKLFPSESWKHLLSFGIDLEESKATEDRRVVDDLQLLFFPQNLPAEVVQYNTPSRTKYRTREFSLYWDDHFQLADRVYFRLGLTLDASNAFLPSQRNGAGTFAPEREFAGAKDVISWTSLSPRLGLAIPVLRRFGDGTRFSVDFARYYHLLPAHYLTAANTNSVGGQIFRWEDANQDGLFQPGEEGQLLRVFGGPYSTIDSSLERPLTDEWGVGLEQDFGKMWQVRVRFFHRNHKRLVETVNQGIPSSSFHPVEIFDSGNDNIQGTSDDQILTVYNQDIDTLGKDHFLLTNPPGFRSTSQGIEATLSKELPKQWFLTLAFTGYKATGPASPGNGEFENDTGIVGSLFDNPNTLLNARGRLFFDRAYLGKLVASGRAPLGFSLGSVLRYSDGLPFGRRLIITGLNQAPFYVMATPRGELGGPRTQFNLVFDQRVGRDFKIASHKFSGYIDIFNLLNLNKSLLEWDLSGPLFDRRLPLKVVNPRVVRFGFKWNF